MKMFNCSLDESNKVFKNKKIIFFGKGSWLQLVNNTPLMALKEQFAYIIDNNGEGTEKIGDTSLHVYRPERIMDEKNCIVILTSPIYMYDMYCQLCNMKLNNSINCYALPFMQMISHKEMNEKLLCEVLGNTVDEKIPRIIHSFWFSGEPKPDEYKKCVDTWSSVLKDYEIKEWNMQNYDWHKHPFLQRAIELKAWAFAADFARLDVLNEFGGIYLDMDVEVFKPFDGLLGNEALFSFGNNILIDLAVMGAEKNNVIVKDLLKIYDDIPIPNEKENFKKFFQPVLVRETLVKHGIKMDGSLQKIDGVAVFPMEFFMPMDVVLYESYIKTKYNYCVHYDNFGWGVNGRNNHEKKENDNKKLWNLIAENN